VVFRKCDLWNFKQSNAWYFTVVELKLAINFLESNTDGKPARLLLEPDSRISAPGFFYGVQYCVMCRFRRTRWLHMAALEGTQL
jgi:hypothetical protein